jgi:SagB-type dehydrogenase family enzyme
MNPLRATELDRTSFPAFRDRILEVEARGVAREPRFHPGCPARPLPKPRPRRLISLDRTLQARRSSRTLSGRPPTLAELSRLLHFGHGVTGSDFAGPAPSAGGLQGVELYVAALVPGELESGVYHYDRPGHRLARILESAERARWLDLVPALRPIEGGALLWVVAGDGERVQDKYGPRGVRFLLLEAGHLMQNLCLLSTSLGFSTVPLGGFLEGEISRELSLARGDLVLYVGLCGAVI